MKPVIRSITEQDYIEMFGTKPQYTLRGYASELDGQVLGVAGVFHSRPLSAFSKLKPEMKLHKRSIVVAVRKFQDLLNNFYGEVFATPEEGEESAERFLKHVGFRKLHDGVFVWQK